MQHENNFISEKPTKQFEVTLIASSEDLRKLTGKDPMPSWVMGEKIAEAMNKGLTRIKLNIHETFLRYQV